MARAKKSEVVEQVEAQETPVKTETVYLSFAEVMKINRELKAKGLVPADPVLPPKKRAKTKAF